jgi:hypothetical protein
MIPGHSITLFRMFALGLVVTFCDLLVLGLSHASAPAKPKKDVNPSLAQPLASGKSVPTVRWKIEGKNPPLSASDKTVVAKPKRPSRSGRASKRAGSEKLKLRAQPMVPVEPQPLIPANLAHYGMLEQPQRYNPGRDRRTGRVIIPQAAGLLHDHFQELDQNHDGAIDPFERAAGRLDIERDATNR